MKITSKMKNAVGVPGIGRIGIGQTLTGITKAQVETAEKNSAAFRDWVKNKKIIITDDEKPANDSGSKKTG